MTSTLRHRIETYYARAGELLLVRMPRSEDPLRDLRRFITYLDVIIEISSPGQNAEEVFNTSMQACRRYAELLSAARPIGGGPSRLDIENAHRDAGDAFLSVHAHLVHTGLAGWPPDADQLAADGIVSERR